ncbi:type I phosphomannose isomerase catalytic subunit [Neobacillus sp. DY30]|uniref:type I phosphomannose isomerase catalytic subunit n=1 Tax=Neobacillus sp. DY30 TaxID=3047871 RepID=UPI0024C0B1E8|nr:type I phosphomannose isomerase catalytic subunit [Neobacillus sp. DY30]WHY01903.1 class I mannose-6-phosphate isomerase [Neobacillus sp. DY30]
MQVSTIKIDGSQPIKLLPTRSWRTYLGGKLLDELHGISDPKDSRYPEEWMMSIISTNRNVDRQHLIDEGLSKLDLPDRDSSLKDLVDHNPVEFLGEKHVKKYGKQTGVLVKLIDTAERLIIQTHPDRKQAQDLFNSLYGKTECWHFVGGREIDGELPHVYMGFKPGVTREQWKALFVEQNVKGMLDCLHKYYVQPGDTFLVEAGIPHAIGSGCLLVEIQEPSDITVRMEKTSPSGLQIDDFLIHQGLGFEKMFDVFKYDTFTRQETLENWKVAPEIVTELNGSIEIELIGYNRTPYFRMTQLEVQTETEVQGHGVFSGLYILSGEGAIITGKDRLSVKKGEQLFIPATDSSFTIINNSNEAVKALRLFGPDVK